jgi:hypothetical protein
MSLAWRLGQFLVFIGLLTLIVFIISIQAGRINLVFCLSSLLLLMTGGYALWRGRNRNCLLTLVFGPCAS